MKKKKCIACAENILIEAVLCKHCHTLQPENDNKELHSEKARTKSTKNVEQSKTKNIKLFVVLFLLIALVSVLSAISASNSNPRTPTPSASRDFRREAILLKKPLQHLLRAHGVHFENLRSGARDPLAAEEIGDLGWMTHKSSDLSNHDTSCSVEVYDTYTHARSTRHFPGGVFPVPGTELGVWVQTATAGTACTKALQTVLNESDIGQVAPTPLEELLDEFMMLSQASNWATSKETQDGTSAISTYASTEGGYPPNCMVIFFQPGENLGLFEPIFTSFFPNYEYEELDLKFSSSSAKGLLFYLDRPQCRADLLDSVARVNASGD